MHKNGFTLIELVIAILIFAIGIAGIAKMQIMAVKGNAYSMQMTRALQAINDQRDILISLDSDDPLLAVATATAPHKLAGADLPERVESLTWTVEDRSNPDIKYITLTAQWYDDDHTTQADMNLLSMSFVMVREI